MKNNKTNRFLSIIKILRKYNIETFMEDFYTDSLHVGIYKEETSQDLVFTVNFDGTFNYVNTGFHRVEATQLELIQEINKRFELTTLRLNNKLQRILINTNKTTKRIKL